MVYDGFLYDCSCNFKHLHPPPTGGEEDPEGEAPAGAGCHCDGAERHRPHSIHLRELP